MLACTNLSTSRKIALRKKCRSRLSVSPDLHGRPWGLLKAVFHLSTNGLLSNPTYFMLFFFSKLTLLIFQGQSQVPLYSQQLSSSGAPNTVYLFFESVNCRYAFVKKQPTNHWYSKNLSSFILLRDVWFPSILWSGSLMKMLTNGSIYYMLALALSAFKCCL